MRNFILIALIYLLLMSPGFYFVTQDAQETPDTVIPGDTGDYAIQGMDAAFTGVTVDSITVNAGGTFSFTNGVTFTGTSTFKPDGSTTTVVFGESETDFHSNVDMNDYAISNFKANVSCSGSYCGLVETITAGTPISYGDLLVMSGTDGKAYTAYQIYAGRSEGRVLMAAEDISAESTGTALKYGDITKASWSWTGESRLYISGTPSAPTALVATATNSYVRFIGYGDGTTIHFEPDGTVIQN